MYRLYERCGAEELLAVMEQATAQGAYGAAYLQALAVPPSEAISPTPRLGLADVPAQAEVDRALSTYEAYVWIPDRADESSDGLALTGEVHR